MTTEKWTALKTDWFQQPSHSNARFCITKHNTPTDTSDRVWSFQVKVDRKPILSPTQTQASSYYEGLWEYDVAEWFIVNPQTGKYIEWNLAPTGAWWMMVFDAPRERIAGAMPDLSAVTTRSAYNDQSWSASLQFPDSLLEAVLAGNNDVTGLRLKHNVCFILGQQPREYLSWASLQAQQPDFHRPAEFIAI